MQVRGSMDFVCDYGKTVNNRRMMSEIVIDVLFLECLVSTSKYRRTKKVSEDAS